MKSSKKQKLLIAYAMDFASFLIQNIKNKDYVSDIILFGSVPRGDYTEKSDIDLFINTKKNIEKECLEIVEKFYKSVKYKEYWKLFGITSHISLKIGNLDKWELKRSIISNGITLYGKYIAKTKTKPYTLFIMSTKGRKKSSQVKIWRKIYGYKQKINKKEYISKGLIKEYNGKRISAGSFIIPIEHTQKIKYFLNKNKISYKLIDFWTDEYIKEE